MSARHTRLIYIKILFLGRYVSKKVPDKKFYSVGHRQFCPNMKRVTLDKVEQAIEDMSMEVELSSELIEKARRPLERMLELS